MKKFLGELKNVEVIILLGVILVLSPLIMLGNLLANLISAAGEVALRQKWRALCPKQPWYNWFSFPAHEWVNTYHYDGKTVIGGSDRNWLKRRCRRCGKEEMSRLGSMFDWGQPTVTIDEWGGEIFYFLPAAGGKSRISE